MLSRSFHSEQGASLISSPGLRQVFQVGGDYTINSSFEVTRSNSGFWTIREEDAPRMKRTAASSTSFTRETCIWCSALPAIGTSVRFRVTIDDAVPEDSHGTDVDANGNGIVDEQRRYQLIRQTGSVRDHTFEIRFLSPGVQVYAFTFG